MAVITLEHAIVRAAALGIEARLVVRVEPSRTPLRIGLTTTDRDPTLAVVSGGREEWLRTRTPSAPDRWDYEAEVPMQRDRFAVRLKKGSFSITVDLLPASVAVLTALGWKADVDAWAEPVLDSAVFEAALQELTSHSGAEAPTR